MAAKKTAAYIIIVILAGIILLNILGQPANILTSKKPNVLFLMLDTLRADHMSVYGYQRNTTPNLDLFAEENLLFLNAISVAPWTPPSIASMFTGLYPTEHGMMPYAHRKKAIKTSTILKDELETIAEMYKKGGYKTAAISSNPWIGPDFGYTQGFDDFLHINRAKAEKINQAAFEKLQGFKNEGKSFFLYPHWPYAPPDEFKEMYENQEPVTYNGENIYTDKEQNFINLYNGEISYLDHHLQLLFDKLKSLSLYDDLIIIVVGDHGEQFMEHGAQGHGYYLYNEEIHVPLMLKVPGQEASQIQQTVSTIDILPTLLKLSNLKVPTKLKV